jgi:uridine kinase
VFDDRLRRGEAVTLTEEDLARIRERMQGYVDANEPFTRVVLPREEAIRLFREKGMDDKADLLRWRSDDRVSVYRFGDHINHFYGQLAPSAGVLRTFDVKACPPGFVLLFPPHGRPGSLPAYEHNQKLFAVFREYEAWARILGLRTVSQLNALVESGRIREHVLITEALHEKKLATIADMFTQHPARPRIILLSGPSSSGKTTTVKRLALQLRVNGLRPVVIGMDNFFVPREQTPRDENGDYDFESIDAIDRDALRKVVMGLLHGEEVIMPRFDFEAGRATSGSPLRLEPEQPIIIEGIHGLNVRLLDSIPDGMKFKIYVSPLTHLNIDDHNRIASSDVRLLRRMVRDAKYRGYTAIDTIRRWPSVRRGEEKNIFPYQERADVIFNSSLPYELLALRSAAVPLLSKITRDLPEYSEAARLLKFLQYFRDVKIDDVPRHSLLREFLGGSAFKY